MKRLFGILLVLAFLVPFTQAAAQDEALVMVIGWEQEPDSLPPITTMTFSGLVDEFYGRDVWDWDNDRMIYPIMVEEIPSFENGMVTATEEGNTQVTYKLREGMLWSDGEEVTADDCVFGHEIDIDPTTATYSRGAYTDVVESVEKIDDYTLVMTYNTSYPDYLTDAYLRCQFPEHILRPQLEAAGTLDGSPYFIVAEPTVGYGPYVLVEWVRGDHMRLEANPLWDGEEPAIDTFILQFIPETSQMMNALDVGEIDLAFQWPDDMVDDYSAIEGAAVWGETGAYQDAIWINMRDPEMYPTTGHPALLDVRVREAIAHAIDRRTIAEQLVGPGTPIPETFWSPQFRPDDIGLREYDPELANQLLDEAGWIDTDGDGTRDKDGVPLILQWYSTTRQLRMDYQVVAQEYLRAVGIDTVLINTPGASMLFATLPQRGIMSSGNYDLALFARSNDPLSPVAWASWTCDDVPVPEDPTGGNYKGFCDPRADELYDLINSTMDPVERLGYAQEIQRVIHEGAVWHGLYLRPTWYALRAERWDVSTIQGNVGTLASNYFQHVETWLPAD